MLEWMKEHRTALFTSCGMFAVMAILMAEFMMGGDEEFLGLLDDSSVDYVAWIWRAGGTLTWPVFMWLLLKPHDLGLVADGNRVITNICIAAAIYGGGGLWVIWTVLEFLVRLASDGVVLLAPLVSVLGIVLPFLYAWGFVALYGFGRARLLGRGDDRGWMGMSLIAAIVGVYGIGILIYLALTAVSLPIAFAIAPIAALGSEELAFHVAIDMLAIAISTGNFASQWWAFKRVDEYFDGPVGAVPVVPAPSPFSPAPQASPVSQASSASPVPPASQASPVSRTPSVSPASRASSASPVPLASPAPPASPASRASSASPVPPASPASYAAPPSRAGYAQAATTPRLVCTCGAELPIDQSKLPQVVSAARFCPRCGIQLLP